MYSFTSRVRYSECDQFSRLTLVSLIDYFQDCSVFHTQSTPRNMEVLTAEGLGWMIACWNIRIQRLPRLGDEIEIQTWNYQTKGLMADRCYQIVDQQGQPYAQADTKWFLFDFAKGQPIRISEEESQVYLTSEARLDLPPTKRRLKLEGKSEATSAITVTEQHLDSNHHMNNAQYIELAREAVGLESEAIAALQVEYCSQATLGDTIIPKIFKSDKGVGISLDSEAGTPFAQVKLVLRS